MTFVHAALMHLLSGLILMRDLVFRDLSQLNCFGSLVKAPGVPFNYQLMKYPQIQIPWVKSSLKVRSLSRSR